MTFLLSPLLLAGLPRMPSAFRAGQHETVSAAVRTGIRYIWGHPILRPVAVALVVGVAFGGMDDLALVFLGRDTFAASDSGVSLRYAASGLGLLLGFALLISRSTRSPAVTVTIAGLSSAVPATCSPVCLRSSRLRSPCSWCVASASAWWRSV